MSTAFNDAEEFYEAERLAESQSRGKGYEQDDFAFDEHKPRPRHHRARPLPLSLSLEQMRSTIDPEGGRLEQIRQLQHAWKAVVGETVAEHTTTLMLRGRELRVSLDSNIWAQELALFETRYVEGLNAFLSGTPIERITFHLARKGRGKRR